MFNGRLAVSSHRNVAVSFLCNVWPPRVEMLFIVIYILYKNEAAIK